MLGVKKRASSPATMMLRVRCRNGHKGTEGLTMPRLLVVDDPREICDVIATYLRGQTYEVTTGATVRRRDTCWKASVTTR